MGHNRIMAPHLTVSEPPTRDLRWVVTVGAVLLTVALTGCRGRSDSREQPEANTAPIRIIQPRGDAIDPPKEFKWTAVPGAASYRVRIADEDAVWPLFVKTVTQPRLVLEPREVTAISPGRIHEWAVE